MASVRWKKSKHCVSNNIEGYQPVISRWFDDNIDHSNFIIINHNNYEYNLKMFIIVKQNTFSVKKTQKKPKKQKTKHRQSQENTKQKRKDKKKQSNSG